MKQIVLALSALGLVAGAGPALAAPCKDAHGQVRQMPQSQPAVAARCKDKQGKFIKCPASPSCAATRRGISRRVSRDDYLNCWG